MASNTPATPALTAEQIFDNAYEASLPPETRALLATPEQEDRAKALAMKGFIIDAPIMIWGEGPWRAMTIRQSYGFTWVPSMLQPPIEMAPGIQVPGQIPYDPANPPAGSIKVSTDPADFPPWPVPVVAAPPSTPAAQILGKQIVGTSNWFYVGPAAQTWPDGKLWTDPSTRNSYSLHVVQVPFGASKWWELLKLSGLPTADQVVAALTPAPASIGGTPS